MRRALLLLLPLALAACSGADRDDTTVVTPDEAAQLNAAAAATDINATAPAGDKQ